MAAAGGRGQGRGRVPGRDPSPTMETITWPGSFGPAEYEPPLPEFPLLGQSEFRGENRIRPYDERVDEWPVCYHGIPCVVQMFDGWSDGGRRFFRCPNGQWNFDKGNCGFAKWVDPKLHQHTENYINHLHNKIHDLYNTRTELQRCIELYKEDLADATRKEVSTEEEEEEEEDPLCSVPWCNCPCHYNKDPPPSGAGGSNEAGPSQASQSSQGSQSYYLY